MHGATLEELRELARRSRRSHGWGVLTLALAMAAAAAVGVLHSLAPGWMWPATYAGLVANGAAFLRFAYVAGEERGAFRRVFRRIADDRKRHAAASVLAESV